MLSLRLYLLNYEVLCQQPILPYKLYFLPKTALNVIAATQRHCCDVFFDQSNDSWTVGSHDSDFDDQHLLIDLLSWENVVPQVSVNAGPIKVDRILAIRPRWGS
jgi:hypothetical protein